MNSWIEYVKYFLNLFIFIIVINFTSLLYMFEIFKNHPKSIHIIYIKF